MRRRWCIYNGSRTVWYHTQRCWWGISNTHTQGTVTSPCPWSRYDRRAAGKHDNNTIMCAVKWQRFIALFKQNWIIWFDKNVRIWSLNYEQSTFTRYRSNNHSSEFCLPQGSQTHLSMWAAVEDNIQSAGRTTNCNCFTQHCSHYSWKLKYSTCTDSLLA